MIAVLLIGDEILSGQIEDQNLKYVLKTFSVTGHQISEVRIVGDDVSQIEDAIRSLSKRHQFVVTSGGVGPTHDDVTIEAVANAFDSKLVRESSLADSLKSFYQDEITEEALTMADIPVGSELIDQSGHNWPILKMKNCFILPGVPQFFQQKFDRLIKFFPKVEKYFLAKIFVKSDESFFAAKLNEFNRLYTNVNLGSYPIFGDPSYNVEITIKDSNLSTVTEVFDKLESFFSSQNTLIFSHKPKQID